MAINVADLVRIGQGREAEVFALDAERVIKVARGEGGHSLDREATARRAAHGAGMPVPVAPELIAPIGRKLLLGGYLRAYRAHHPIDGDVFERWLVVLACVRLTYAIAGERESLLAAIERGG